MEKRGTDEVINKYKMTKKVQFVKVKLQTNQKGYFKLISSRLKHF